MTTVVRVCEATYDATLVVKEGIQVLVSSGLQTLMIFNASNQTQCRFLPLIIRYYPQPVRSWEIRKRCGSSVVDSSRNNPPWAEMDKEKSLLNGKFSFNTRPGGSLARTNYLHLLSMWVTTGVRRVSDTTYWPSTQLMQRITDDQVTWKMLNALSKCTSWHFQIACFAKILDLQPFKGAWGG